MLNAPQTENPQLTNLNKLVEEIHNSEMDMVRLQNKQERADYLRFMASMNNITLNDQQIDTILEQAQFTAEQLLAKQTKTVNVNPKVIALQMSLALTAIYYVPGMFAGAMTEALLKAFLSKIMSPQKAKNYGTFLNLAGNIFLGAYGPRNLMNHYLPQFVEQYGSKVYLAAPLGVYVYQKGSDIVKGCGTALWNVGADCYSLGRTLTDLAEITEPELPPEFWDNGDNYYYSNAQENEDEDNSVYTKALIRQFTRERDMTPGPQATTCTVTRSVKRQNNS